MVHQALSRFALASAVGRISGDHRFAAVSILYLYKKIMREPPSVCDVLSAKAFIRWCVREIGPGYHPDTPFMDYRTECGERCFSDDEARHLDLMTEHAFRFCDPYIVGLEAVEAVFPSVN